MTGRSTVRPRSEGTGEVRRLTSRVRELSRRVIYLRRLVHEMPPRDVPSTVTSSMPSATTRARKPSRRPARLAETPPPQTGRLLRGGARGHGRGLATGAMASPGLFERGHRRRGRDHPRPRGPVHALVRRRRRRADVPRDLPEEASRAAASGAQAFALVTDQSFDQPFTAAAAATTTSRRRRRRRRFLRPLAVSVATPPGDTLPGEDGAPAADWSRTQLSFETHGSVVHRMTDASTTCYTFRPVAYPDRRSATWYVSRTGHDDASARRRRRASGGSTS